MKKRPSRKRKIMDARVSAIRKNTIVGKKTASVMTERYSDDELLEKLEAYNVLTTREAVEWALNVESLFREENLNCRGGVADFAELKSYRDWNKRLKTYRQRAK